MKKLNLHTNAERVHFALKPGIAEHLNFPFASGRGRNCLVSRQVRFSRRSP